jgi:hypothetical protein
MDLRDYTTFDDVRAALGVTAKEIGDEVIGLPLYEDNLINEMDSLDANFLEDYDAVLLSNTEVKAELKMLRAGRLFCTYAVANQCLASLPLFSPREISDGKASFSRYNDNPYATTIKEVRSRYAQYKTALLDAYMAVKASSSKTTAPVYMVISTPTANPITG